MCTGLEKQKNQNKKASLHQSDTAREYSNIYM